MPLSSADKALLRSARHTLGRRWKAQIRHLWETGQAGPGLQALRNRADFGPKGLDELLSRDLDYAMGAQSDFGERCYEVLSDATVKLYELDIALSGAYTGNREHEQDKAVQALREVIRPFLEAARTPNILAAIQKL